MGDDNRPKLLIFGGAPPAGCAPSAGCEVLYVGRNLTIYQLVDGQWQWIDPDPRQSLATAVSTAAAPLRRPELEPEPTVPWWSLSHGHDFNGQTIAAGQCRKCGLKRSVYLHTETPITCPVADPAAPEPAAVGGDLQEPPVRCPRCMRFRFREYLRCGCEVGD